MPGFETIRPPPPVYAEDEAYSVAAHEIVYRSLVMVGAWRYELSDSSTPLVIREQRGTSWQTFDMAVASGAERFLVREQPNRAGESKIHIYHTSDGK